MSDRAKEVADPEVKKMLRARSTSATLKLELVSLRSRLPDVLIFAFEGVDDKLVYSQWIRRMRPDIQFEPYPCKGKGNLLTLRRATLQDVNGLSSGVFFFVDRDFDELRGEPGEASTFMTENYSIENSLADPATVEQLLINEFHCHGNPQGRAVIVTLYERLYDQFLALTREANLRLLASHVHRIQLSGYVAARIGQLATVEVDSVTSGSFDPEQLVPLDREMSGDEREAVDTILGGLDPRKRYRGKFAILFLVCWLARLAASRSKEPKRFFEGMDLTANVKVAEIGISLLASRAEPPAGFAGFLESVRTAA